MLKLVSVYAQAPYEVRLKSKILQNVLLLSLVSEVVLFPLGLFLQSFLLSVACGVSLGIFGLSLWLLRRGSFEVSASVLVVGVVGLTMTVIPLLFEGTVTVLVLSFVLSVFFCFLCVILSRRRWIFVLGASGLVIMVSIDALMGFSEKGGGIPVLVFVVSFVFTFIGMVVGLCIQTVLGKISQDLRQQLEESAAAREASRRLVVQVAGQIDKSDHLSVAAEQTTSAGFQIERNVHSIKDQIVNLNQKFSNSETALENINKNLSQLTTLADEQAGIVSHSGSAIEEMVASIQSVTSIIDSRTQEVRSLKETARSGRTSIGETVESFRTVVRQIESIKEMTGIITGIAAQTNLLAMNAAIEAAHAGGAGRGFSVVASEIRKLAESSGQSAGTIGNSLKALTAAIEKTDQRVKASGLAFESVQTGVERVSEAMEEIGASTKEMNAGTKEILHSTTQLQAATQGVDGSVKQVFEAYQQILSELRQITQVISEVAAGMDEIGVGSSEIRRAIAGLTTLSVELKNQTAQLQGAVA
jgi:methyl-accepting chemotaxis protein